MYRSPLPHRLRRALMLLALCWLPGALATGTETETETEIEIEIESLLKQSRAAQAASLDLLHELYVTESSLLFPQTNLLVVMLTQGHDSQILLERIQLTIDDQPVILQRYDVSDIEKFMDRAYQVLYTTLISPGYHRVQAQLYDMGMPQSPRMSTEFSIEKGSQPLFVELNIASGKVGHKVWR